MNDALQKGYAEYHADEQAEARFHCIADRFLSDAGYPTLYAGNPFDWIFLYSAMMTPRWRRCAFHARAVFGQEG